MALLPPVSTRGKNDGLNESPAVRVQLTIKTVHVQKWLSFSPQAPTWRTTAGTLAGCNTHGLIWLGQQSRGVRWGSEAARRRCKGREAPGASSPTDAAVGPSDCRSQQSSCGQSQRCRSFGGATQSSKGYGKPKRPAGQRQARSCCWATKGVAYFNRTCRRADLCPRRTAAPAILGR